MKSKIKMAIIIIASIIGIFAGALALSKTFREATVWSFVFVGSKIYDAKEVSRQKQYRNKLNRQTKAIRIEWTDELAGDFSFKDSWVYEDVRWLLKKDSTITVAGLKTAREEEVRDDMQPVAMVESDDGAWEQAVQPAKPQKRVPAPTVLDLETFCKHWEKQESALDEEYFNITHYLYTIQIDGVMRGFIAADNIDRNKVECQTSNFTVGCSESLCLNLFITDKMCYPVVAENRHSQFIGYKTSVPVERPFSTFFPCTTGSIKIDRTYWKRGIVRASFEFTFHSDSCPDGDFTLSGRIYTLIRMLPETPVMEGTEEQYSYLIDLSGKY